MQALHHLTLIDAQRSEFARGEVQVQHFVLLADHFDLAQSRYAANFHARLFHVVAQLTQGQAVGGEGVDRAEDVTELVVERRPLYALRELVFDVVDLLAHLVPDFRDVLGTGGVAQVHIHRGLTGARVAFHIVEGVELFELFLDPVGDLLEGFLLGRPRPFTLDHHGLDGERRVFFAPQVEVREHTHQQCDEHQIPDERLMLEGPFREVERPFH
ncbi:hypothetical protein D3C84_746670 [compost metagenome]